MLEAALNVFVNNAPSDQLCINAPGKPVPPPEPKKEAPAVQILKEQTIFEQFGGDEKMTVFVDDFMKNVMANSELA